MELHTTRFGTINIEAGDIITFPDGLVGLSQLKRFVLINHQEGSPFRWLQSVEEPGFALLLIDPWFFCADYEVVLSDAEVERLRVSDDSVLVVYTTVTIPPGKPHAMTANLMAPIVINATERCGRQVILEDERYHTRHPILQEMWRTTERAESAG
ncbi:MAG: flagellar assembly protein FliW [Fimbriimonadales bacterium]|jgi:flagellar assembly factor FliW|nr:flagellar assembly protein FliW [Armatimonadota bacterium]MCX7688390.1 flagellar assembly protein FliW [Fimbriimonadales bacterium]CUU07253.1 flagellar assembly factor FliW [Armatimonadetes bacterium GBS]CUU34632.1 flagellar assembly factor FliW [Armatimonadetes bacterium DC]CUU37885.1 flagellar assembly factor FliW [Armatimonadetes bacterium GXS]GBC89849.1 Flagellar assembly factor FliW [bacterium HR14]